MIKTLKNVKTYCFDINLMMLYSRIYQRHVTRIVRVMHTLTKHECYPPLMCKKFQRTYSNEQVITAWMYSTVELMVCLLNN